MSSPAFHSHLTVRRFAALAGAMSLLLAFGTAGVSAAGPEVLPAPAGAQGVVHARGAGGSPFAASDPTLLYHGGEIMTGSDVTAIYWGSSWSSYSGDKVSGLARFYTNLNGSNYMGTNTEYTGTNGTVGQAVHYSGSLLDGSAAPAKAPSTSAVRDVVSRALSAAGQAPVHNGYYPVYSDQKRGHARYCAWHSYGTINGVLVQFAFFFNLDGDSGCDPQDPGTAHSQGLEALANVSGHEISEAVTDPSNGGWWDGSGAENADKCAWTFSGTVSLGGEQWKVQGNWSNAAYLGNGGYTKGGCIQGN